MPDLPAVGHKVSFTKTVTDADLQAFAAASGDDQPLHLDDSFGARTRFGKRIAHGMLSAGFISAVLGTKLYPAGIVIYLGQSLQFRRPVVIGDTIRPKPKSWPSTPRRTSSPSARTARTRPAKPSPAAKPPSCSTTCELTR